MIEREGARSGALVRDPRGNIELRSVLTSKKGFFVSIQLSLLIHEKIKSEKALVTATGAAETHSLQA